MESDPRWYEGFFEDEWLYVQRTIFDAETSDGVADHIVSLLALEPGARVLDVPCGAGRISLPLAARGLEVTGVDRTPALLEDARAGAAARGLQVHWEERDMRDLPWSERFEAATNVWGSFGYFDDAGNADFARAVRTCLVPGGRFLIDVPSMETILPRFAARDWHRTGDAHVLEERHYDALLGRVVTSWTIFHEGRTFRRTSSIRLYSFPELRTVLEGVGFSRVDVFGSLEGDPFALTTRMVVVATR